MIQREKAEKTRKGGTGKRKDKRSIAHEIMAKLLCKRVQIGMDSKEKRTESLDNAGRKMAERGLRNSFDKLEHVTNESWIKKIEVSRETKPEKRSRTGNGAIPQNGVAN
jgi:hypothetical protein